MHGMAFRMNEKWFTSRWGEGQEGGKETEEVYGGGGRTGGGRGLPCTTFQS